MVCGEGVVGFVEVEGDGDSAGSVMVFVLGKGRGGWECSRSWVVNDERESGKEFGVGIRCDWVLGGVLTWRWFMT